MAKETAQSTQNNATRGALVTGANARLGRALALEAAELGYGVIVHFHKDEKGAQETVALIESKGRKAHAISADLSQMNAITRLCEEAQSKIGALSCLINNASLFEYDRLIDMSAQSWQTHLALNLTAPVFLAQAFAQAFMAREAREDGVIVNLIDQRVLHLTPEFFSYTIAKAGLWTATQTMAQALSPHIRVNAIGPGPVLPSARQSAENFARQAKTTPLGRVVGVEEICGALRMILQSPSMTGQLIVLDSGQHLEWRSPIAHGTME